MKKPIVRLFGIAVVLTCITAAGALGLLWCWSLANALSVLLPLTGGGAILCFLVVFLLRFRSRIGVASAVGAIVAGLLVARGLDVPTVAPSQEMSGTDAVRIVEFNIWKDNRAPDAAARWILAQRPDVVVLLEAAGQGLRVADALASRLPYRTTCRGGRPCGTMILSRVPAMEQRGLAHGDADNRRALSAAWARFDRPVAFSVMALHLSRPLPLGQQERELAEVAALLPSLGTRRLIVAGDFNAPRWTRAIGRLTALPGLRLLGSAPSWPVLPLLPPFLDLDHALIGDGWSDARTERGPEIGSDHRPMLIELDPCR